MGGLTTVFARATSAEADMNNRFQAQQGARLALDKLRREVHCASSASPVGSNVSSITLTVPSYCKTYSGNASVTWCTRSVATNRYALYRVDGTTCTGGVKWADYLTPTSTAAVCSGALCVFNSTAQSTSSSGTALDHEKEPQQHENDGRAQASSGRAGHRARDGPRNAGGLRDHGR